MLQYDSDADHWVNIDLPTMASGRIDFTQSGSDYIATGFIEDPTRPNDPATPISSTSITAGNGRQLAFTLARAADLSLLTANFVELPWDVDFPAAQTQVQFRSNDDPLYPNETLTNLRSTDNTNISIDPAGADGPWLVGFTDPTLVVSNAATDTTAGGSVRHYKSRISEAD